MQDRWHTYFKLKLPGNEKGKNFYIPKVVYKFLYFEILINK